MTACIAVQIKLHHGDRESLMALFALADDSWHEIAGYRDRGALLAARDEGAIIGLALIIDAELKALAVAESHRRRGIGRALVRCAAAEAARRGITRIEVATAAADISNLRFYQLMGFRMLRVERDAFTRENGYSDVCSDDGIMVLDRVVLDLMLADHSWQ